ncbi:MAG: thiamine pyrophosphate-requiring protein [Acetobacteraceae bacterium]
MTAEPAPRTAAAAILDALVAAGVSFLFANFGSDHPALIEALAEARASGRPVPTVITCPNEMVALSAAHGAALLTGRAEAVLVHVECGTQALAGAMHNAARARVPVLILAGLTPFTQEGELPGSRNEFIHWLQDVPDQRSIVRGYVKYEHEIRSGRNAGQIIRRALKFAHSDPQGPVYLTVAREVLEERIPRPGDGGGPFPPLARVVPAEEELSHLVSALVAAKRPVIVTSYLGRNPAAVAELGALTARLGIGVIESVPSAMNFPADDPAWLGVQWSEPRQNEALAAADLVLVIESDVPWIPSVNRPNAGAKIYHLDVDPLKEHLPLWHIPARASFRCDAASVLAAINRRLADTAIDEQQIAARRAELRRRHAERSALLAGRERPEGGEITVPFAVASLRRHLDADTIVLNEAITSYPLVVEHLGARPAGSVFASGGGALGWHGGAAIGAKLARPGKTLVAITGDGTYLFSVPATVHWMARRYRTPFLTVVLNNRGWRAPKLSMRALHPAGYASRANDLDITFDPPPDYGGIAAAAGGAFAASVRLPEDMEPGLQRAFRAVREEKRAAVLDVWLRGF